MERRFTKLAWKSVRVVCCHLKEKVEKKTLKKLSSGALLVLIDTVKHEVYVKESIMSEALTFWIRGEREFPFPDIPKNGGL